VKKRRYLAILAALAFALTACGGGAEEPAAEAPADEPAAEAPAEGVVVGVSWNNFQEERWGLWDAPALQGAIEAAGGTYISADAASSAEQQLADVENLIAQGAQALVILAQDGTAILPAVESALSQGIPVIAYDRLIENPDVLYITFDNVEVGRMQARAVLEAQPEGNYVFIKGNAADANSDFLRGGQAEVLADAVAAGDIVEAGESYTDNWDPAVAQRNMEQILTQLNNDVDAVVASNDGTAGGVIAALEAQGLAGQVPVSGQDGDGAALNRIALGTQTVSVWKDARELGAAAGAAAVRLARGESPSDVAGGFAFDTPGGNTLATILLKPIPVTRANLEVVVDAGWITLEALCQGVAAGTVEICG
jgi:D-xylose transport system substrate-binding protein